MLRMKNRRSFTLIEMLAVMFIIGILLAISVPAFNAAFKSTKVKEGAKGIYAALKFARQYAVAHRKDIYVVFATQASGNPDMEYRAFKVYDPDKKQSIEDWSFLSRGAQVDTGCNMLNDTVVIPFPNDNSSSNKTVSFVKFKPTGSPSTSRTIKVVDVKDNTVYRSITYNDMSGSVKLFDLCE